MSQGFDLEGWREIFKDNRVWLAVAQIKKVMIASDRSVVRVAVSLLNDDRDDQESPIIARMSWSILGEESGFIQLPRTNDIVLVGMAEGDEEHCFVLSKLSNREDKIPVAAAAGDMVAKATAGTKLWLISNTKVLIGTNDESEPDENLVLGQVFKELMIQFLTKVSTHKHIGNLGYLTSAPDIASEFVALKTSPVEDELVLSDLAFTEKG